MGPVNTEKNIEISEVAFEYFHSPSSGRLSFHEVVENIVAYIKEAPDSKYQVVVGTDSPAVELADFVTALVVRRIGQGGRYFWQRSAAKRFYQPLDRERIYFEVTRSLNIAQRLSEELKKYFSVEPAHDGKGIAFSYHFSIAFEVHIDVGENGATKDMIKEVVGMVRGWGFDAKMKPESYAASAVADRHT